MTERNSNSDTSHMWSQTETVTHPTTNIVHWHLTSVSRQIHSFWFCKRLVGTVCQKLKMMGVKPEMLEKRYK